MTRAVYCTHHSVHQPLFIWHISGIAQYSWHTKTDLDVVSHIIIVKKVQVGHKTLTTFHILESNVFIEGKDKRICERDSTGLK